MAYTHPAVRGTGGRVKKNSRCEHDGKVVRRAAAARALPRRHHKPRRDLRLGPPPCLATAAFNASNLALDATVVTEHNGGLQLEL